MSAAPGQTQCPTCGTMAERQVSAGAGLVFKGSGFYITDYGKDGKKSQTPAAGETAGGGGDSSTKSDASGGKPGGEEKKAPESKAPASGPSSSKSAPDKQTGKAKSGE